MKKLKAKEYKIQKNRAKTRGFKLFFFTDTNKHERFS